MQTFDGIKALSDFRRKGLLKNLQVLAPSITDVSAEYIHFVHVNKLAQIQNDQLKQLLNYGEPYAGKKAGELFLVTPRPGTISPWSSKATDIVHNCGLTSVQRVERGIAYYIKSKAKIDRRAVATTLNDRMTETIFATIDEAEVLFGVAKPKPYAEVAVLKQGKVALETANVELGLALTDDEIAYLATEYTRIKRNPTDVELMMFAQVNSEHCRHKIFNADWTIDGQKQPKSLFQMIKNTYEKNSAGVLSAYHDNAAVLEGPTAERLFPDSSGTYRYVNEPIHLVTKVETHNHPTAIAPFPGAATGSGGEIRDEAATGRGGKPKFGMAGYSVSNLNLPTAKRPWEQAYGKPSRIVSPLDIIIEAPLGAAAFANEYGRPNLLGYFRTFEQHVDDGQDQKVWGYHKPIMIAGGLGNIRGQHIDKQKLEAGDLLIVIGGPAMLIGLGGSAASSMQTGSSHEDLDFASVQRGNAEVERRAQEVIDACCGLGDKNPIKSIHDVGAGGLSNAFPELVQGAGLGAKFELRSIPNAEPSMSPMEIWCNEAQERYVLGIKPKDLVRFETLCQRERCPFAVVGMTTKTQQLVLSDSLFGNTPIDIPMELLFGNPPKMSRIAQTAAVELPTVQIDKMSVAEAAKRVLMHPAVGSKKFLITIGDRTVTGLITRDQMVGPWQVPVSDVAVSASGFNNDTGEAMAIGERTPLAIINAPAAARMAVGEAVTNIAAADIAKLSDIKLSANWMAAAGEGQEDARLFASVKAVGEEFCPSLGLTIPVGKDSLSMRTRWQDGQVEKSVTSPVSLIISAFAPVQSVDATLTAYMQPLDSQLIAIDLSKSGPAIGGSVLAQVFNQTGSETPDVEPGLLKKFFDTIQKLRHQNQLLAYHDRSDGGLFTTLCEMAFAGRCGLDIDIAELPGTNVFEKLFHEGLGAVIQINLADQAKVLRQLEAALGKGRAHAIGSCLADQQVSFTDNGKVVYHSTRARLEQYWADTSYRVQALRDNPDCARQEYGAIGDNKDPGLQATVTAGPLNRHYKKRPKVAIFREQGVNGQIEMAAAFDMAGFEAIDVHMSDLFAGRIKLHDMAGMVACGGFSYGDVLGAGEGWAKSVLFHKDLRRTFEIFFARPDSFTLGVCNGCQMLSSLKQLIPGTEHWPRFLRNTSEQFEARVVNVKVNESPSIFFRDMAGSVLSIPVAHGEGRAVFADGTAALRPLKDKLVPLQFVDSYGKASERYPANPNGSAQGITALTSLDGRATIMMPHPERAFLSKQHSWRPADWSSDAAPWLRMFQNARVWVN